MFDTSNASEVSAISVIDLARELLLRKVLTETQIASIAGADVLAASERLQAGQDISSVLPQRLPERCLIALWQQAKVQGDARLGWQIGSQVWVQAQGMLAHWIRHCQTLEEAFRTFTEHVYLLNASEQWQIHHRRSSVELSFSYPQHKHYPDIAVHRSLASIKSWSEYLTGETLNVDALYLPWPRDKCNHEQITRLFQCPVYYAQAESKIRLSAAEIQKPLIQANAYIADLMARQARSCIDSTPYTLTGQVEALLRQDIQYFAQIENSAHQLCMSRATLYRKLKAEHTNFSEVLEKYRYGLWQQATAEGMENSQQLADRLGFSDISSYYKAKKRWQAQSLAGQI